MTGDERVEGRSEALTGRKATNPPDNRMKHNVLFDDSQVLLLGSLISKTVQFQVF